MLGQKQDGRRFTFLVAPRMQSAPPRARGAVHFFSGATERGGDPLAQFPMFPLWTDAYLADTTHLTTFQHGAYLLLLITMWRAKGCRLPDNDKLLARYSGTSLNHWVKAKPTLKEFFTIKDGWWKNERLNDEFDFVNCKRLRQSNAGKASALKRKNRGSTSVVTTGQPTPNPLPTPTPIKEKIIKKNGILCPENFRPDQSVYDWAVAEGFTDKQIRTRAAMMIDWSKSSAASKGLKKDWNAAFRNWLRRDIKDHGPPKQHRDFDGGLTKNQLAG